MKALPPTIHFRVGVFVYSVRRLHRLTLDGEPIDGYCASTARCIMLDGQLEGEVLVTTLRHEHCHAWAFEVGEPRTSEDLANFTACVSAAFDTEFAAQGGLDTLRKIPIEPAPKSRPQMCHRA